MRSFIEDTPEAAYLISGRRTEDVPSPFVRDMFFYCLYTGHYVCKKSFYIKRERIDSYLLILTLEGSGELCYEGQKYILSKNTAMLIDGRIMQEYYALDDGWTFQYIHFDGAMSKSCCEYICSLSGPVFKLGQKYASDVSDMLEILFRETENDTLLDYALISAKIYTVLATLISHNSKTNEKIKSAESLSRALTYIVENYNRPIKTSDIAGAAFLSRSYLSEIFNDKYGMPPHEFLTNYRLTRVKDYLLSTDASISEIAEQNGFGDLFSLSRVFRKKFGISPSEYRKQFLK